jgi:hypothetical protein
LEEAFIDPAGYVLLTSLSFRGYATTPFPLSNGLHSNLVEHLAVSGIAGVIFGIPSVEILRNFNDYEVVVIGARASTASGAGWPLHDCEHVDREGIVRSHFFLGVEVLELLFADLGDAVARHAHLAIEHLAQVRVAAREGSVANGRQSLLDIFRYGGNFKFFVH